MLYIHVHTLHPMESNHRDGHKYFFPLLKSQSSGSTLNELTVYYLKLLLLLPQFLWRVGPSL